MSCRRRAVAGVVLALGISAAAWAEAPGSLPDLNGDVPLAAAIRRGEGQLPAIRAAESRVLQARFKLDAARALLNPQVTVQHGVGNNTGGLDEDLIISQTIELGGKRGARISQALAELRRAEADLLALRAKSSFEVRQAYLGVVVTLGETALARETLALAEQFHKTAVTQFQAGEVPQTEVVRAELELALAQRAVEDAEADVAIARVSLGSLIAADPTAKWSIAAELPPLTPPPDLDALRKSVASRPELVAARAQIEASSAAAIGARRAGNPDLFAIGTLGHFDQGGVSARAGIIFPLFDQGSLRATRRSAEAAIDENRALLADSQRTLALELDLAYARLTKARSRAVSIENDQMPKAKKLLSMAQEAYQHGLGSYLELLDAQRAYNGVAATLLRARADYALALADVDRAAGLPPAGGMP